MQGKYPIEEIKRLICDSLLPQLDSRLYYHSLKHTLDVTQAAVQIAKNEGINNSEELDLLTIACLFHDVGFLRTYNEHEQEGCNFASEYLPPFGVTPENLSVIKGLIMATKIPQTPLNLLEKVICDADLDYLGREDYGYISERLHDEWVAFGILTDEKDWLIRQIRFLEKHTFFTEYCKKNRQQGKEARLKELKVALENENKQ